MLKNIGGFDSGPRLVDNLKQMATAIDGGAVKDSGAIDYVPLATDRQITRSRATAQTLTLPTNAAVAYPIGYELKVTQTGAGALTLVAPAGGAINKLATKTLVVAGQHGRVVLTKTAANTWNASGDLTAA